jgi:hypothetical protein
MMPSTCPIIDTLLTIETKAHSFEISGVFSSKAGATIIKNFVAVME